LKRKRRPVVGPRLRRVLALLFLLVALMGVNSAYLVTVRAAEYATGLAYQGLVFQWMFLAHLVLGLVLTLPLVVFGLLHMRNAWSRPNRRAVRMGLALFCCALGVVVTGVLLTRVELRGVELGVRRPGTREAMYWAHVALPVIAAWLYVLHRLAGRRIRWRVGVRWAAVAGVLSLALLGWHVLEEQSSRMSSQGLTAVEYMPAQTRVVGGEISETDLMNDQYCLRCHADAHEQWSSSAHRFSSFNNPAYAFSVLRTREAVLARDGNLDAARFCAGCHDVVPLVTGQFDDPAFDETSASGQAGLTCTVCHAVTDVHNNLGNGAFTLERPTHYPFATSDDPVLSWISDQLVKSNPSFHKQTFLKPVHKTVDFCGACHKVHIPEELTQYRWLRGQNHRDAFLLSGVSGFGVTSFYYPPKAQENCNGCHMPLVESADFGARDFDGSGRLSIHHHLFVGANTGITHLTGQPDWTTEAHRQFLEGSLRVDVFGVREEGRIDGAMHAPVRPEVPVLEPGKEYLVEVVLRTLTVGHVFTQGTADSNQVWVEASAKIGEREVGGSGAMDEAGVVDPWAHFVNVYMLDRDGNRIDRRNVEDIFVPLYNHQIPPGAADVVHYRLRVPEDAVGSLAFDVALHYRKFDTTYMRHVFGEDYVNDLPIVTIARDRVEFPIAASEMRANGSITTDAVDIPEWQRWNDYGIGLLRKGESGSSKGQLRQAAEAFERVEELGRADGPVNLTRVYLKEGRLEEAVAALERARSFDPPAPVWTLAWHAGLVNMENGRIDEAIASFRSIVELDTLETRERGFDFSRDWRVWNELGRALFERSKWERGESRAAVREGLLRESIEAYREVLALDSEDQTAHWGLAQAHGLLGETEEASRHRKLHDKYRLDENARDRAIALARARDPAADHAAEAVVIYDLHREPGVDVAEVMDGAGPLPSEDDDQVAESNGE